MNVMTEEPPVRPDEGGGATAATITNGDAAVIRAEVGSASDVLFPLWPLESVIAVNPLGNLDSEPFESAGTTVAAALGAAWLPGAGYLAAARDDGRISDEDIEAALLRAASEGRLTGRPGAFDSPVEDGDTDSGTDPVTAEVSKWCAAFLDDGQATWPMPGRDEGLYSAWKSLVAVDPTSRRLGGGDLRERAGHLPALPEAALGQLLGELGVEPGERPEAIRRLLGRCPGWGSAIRWRSERTRGGHPADLVDLCAIVAFYVVAFEGALDLAARGEGAADERVVLLEALEWHWRDRLLAKLGGDVHRELARPDAQAVFCIDARSEGIRRHLEAAGNYETVGFAGFFGLAVSNRPLGAPAGVAQCPVLVEPGAETTESPLPGSEREAERWLARRRSRAATIEAFHRTKNDLSSKFALAELTGWFLGPLAAARTLAPGRAIRPAVKPATEPVVSRPSREQAEAEAASIEREDLLTLARVVLGRGARRIAEVDVEALRRQLVSSEGLEIAAPPRVRSRRWAEFLAEADRMIDPRSHEELVARIGSVGMTEVDQIGWAEVSLRMMGLTENFGRIVLLCGHGSTNVNNPYGSALDCGACGGNQGGPNARVAAVLLNSPSVRTGLAERGIDIPADTVFVAGLHDTATDEVEIFDFDQVPVTHRSDLLHLRRDLARAGRALAEERAARLPEGHTSKPRTRSRDWAQVRPEWGLARNAAFIIGPRDLTAGLDLECRTFLHSYRADADPDGSGLETILTAPLVVAEWINLQYYFSTVDPEVFGAGDKTLHNVVGLHGVQTGSGGDLRMGLPRQSVFAGDRAYHEPMRLLAVVEAPRERIKGIVDRNPVLREMLGGGWAALCARSGPGEPWFRLRRDLEWEQWKPAGELIAGTDEGGRDDA